MISQAVEDYLKTIYHLEAEGNATAIELAKRLNVSPASVTSMIKRLAQLGLVEYTSYRGFPLTPAGRKVALETIRHHRLLELYLHEALGYSWDKVHEEAERLEHHISEEFEARIDELLGYPTHDPHGDPIPTVHGELPEDVSRPLQQAAVGDVLIVQRVSDANPEVLRYLEQVGLRPRTVLTVEARAPFNGPLTLRIANTQDPAILGFEVAGYVYIRPLE